MSTEGIADRHRCEVELIDMNPSDGLLLVGSLKINGTPVHMPRNVQVEVIGRINIEPIALRLTLLPTRLEIKGAEAEEAT